MSFSTDALTRATTTMSRSFATAGTQMSNALERISSGSRINRPSDDFTSFSKLNTLKSEQTTFENAAISLRENGAVVQQALDVANQIMSDMDEMKTALTNGDTEQAAAIGQSISEALSLTASDGSTLISATLATDLGITTADGTTAIGVTISAITDISAVDGTANLAAVNAGITAMETFINEISGLKSAVDSQTKLADIMASNSEAVASALTSIDEAAEMAKYVEADVRQQAAISMFSQANLSRRNISLLYR